MSGRTAFHSEIHTGAWHWRPEGEATLLSAERAVGHALPDGAWRQRLEPAAPSPIGLPADFTARCRRWRRFLARLGAREFQLKRVRRALRIWGPPMRRALLPPEWQGFVSLTSRGVGLTSLPFHFRAHGFPDQAMMRRFEAIAAMPPLKPVRAVAQPICFEGDLLLRALAHAMDHGLDTLNALGQWHSRAPWNGARKPGPRGDAPDEDEEGDATAWPTAPLTPADWLFTPHRDAPPPREAWLALTYEPDDHVLYCVSRRRWRPRYLAVALERPLYRCLRDMVFGGPARPQIVKGVQYRLPFATLFLSG